ncbi:UNVERIFIED_CONTAM: hypothetical protein K2H54_019226 [Gekko kuhli]
MAAEAERLVVYLRQPKGSIDWLRFEKGNVSSDGAEARRRLRECDGLVDALLHALQSAVGKKDTDNKSVENCVCIMRNLSYHVHKEVPGADKFQELEASQLGSLGGTQKKKKDDAGCFGGKKAKGVCGSGLKADGVFVCFYGTDGSAWDQIACGGALQMDPL